MKKIDYSDIVKDNELRAKKLADKQQKEYQNLMQYMLDDKDMNDINLYASAALSDLEKDIKINKDYRKYLQQLRQKGALKKEQQKIRDRDYEKFSVASLWSVFTIFIVLLFFKSWLLQDYIVNYSFDVLIAIVAAFVAVRSFMTKRRIIMKYGFDKKFLYLDIFTILLCLAIKLFSKTNFDVTFLLLVASYWLSKRQLKPMFENVL